jgi:hypothetical protein
MCVITSSPKVSAGVSAEHNDEREGPKEGHREVPRKAWKSVVNTKVTNPIDGIHEHEHAKATESVNAADDYSGNYASFKHFAFRFC